MKKFLFGLVVGGVLGGGAGFVVAVFVYPFIFLADVVADETLADAESRTVVADGTFIHADPSDPIHHGKGRVTVYADTVRLEPDFEVGPGPKYRVYLVTDAPIRESAEVTDSRFVDLGALRAFKGSQNYAVPADVDLSAFRSVVIWCEAFGVLISPADLVFR